MDKFGIFKLLGAFMNFYSENKNSAFSGEDIPRKSGEQGINTLGDLLAAVIGKNNAAEQFPSKQNTPSADTARPPLQNSMLGVMKRHDDIVNRIKRK